MKSSATGKLRPFWIILLGVGLLAAGFIYEAVFNGIPYQDPTPAMIASWNFNAGVAQVFYSAGAVVLLASVALALFRRVAGGRDQARRRGLS